MNNEHWTFDVPKEEGDYFFYGDLTFKKEDPHFNPTLSILHVNKTQTSLMYVVDGQFFYPSEKGSWYGKFKRYTEELPEL